MQSSLFNLSRSIITILFVLSLVACDSIPSLNDTLSGRKIDYKKQSRSIERLEVPPGMVADTMQDMMPTPKLASLTDKKKANKQVAVEKNNIPATDTLSTKDYLLPNYKNMQLIRDGNVRTLLIEGNKEQVWNKMREFWLYKGMLIKRETPSTGILETEWAENRADIPDGIIRKTLGKVLAGVYSSGNRDKYRVRSEEDFDKSTTQASVYLYLTHYGMQEVFDDDYSERLVWVPRARDPELEAEILGEMMVFFGLEEAKAKVLLAKRTQARANKAVIAKNTQGETRLLIKETFPRAWRRTGVALDRINFIVEDKDRNQGIYFVKYVDPLAKKEQKGWFSKLNFWQAESKKDDSIYRIVLTKDDENTIVSVLNEQNKIINNGTANRILTLLSEQLK